MRVLEKKEIECECPYCKSKLAYTSDDISSNRLDEEYIYCGSCKGRIKIFHCGERTLYHKSPPSATEKKLGW